MNMNTVRQMERRLEASQETIVDQLQTIEKFRELVRHLQVQCTCISVTLSVVMYLYCYHVHVQSSI